MVYDPSINRLVHIKCSIFVSDSDGQSECNRLLLDDEDFRQIDVNRDNRVNSTELYRPLAQALVTRYEMSGMDIVTIMQVDIDDDAFASFAELQSTYADLTQNDFHLIDNNGDNRVSANEYYSAESQAIIDRK